MCVCVCNQTHEQQLPAIQLMIASLSIDVGLLHYEERDYRAALLHFRESHSLYRELSAASGEHIRVSSLTILANTLAVLGQFREAFGHWREALRITEGTVGHMHEAVREGGRERTVGVGEGLCEGCIL